MPAAGLLAAMRPQVAGHAPFAQMRAEDLDFFLAHSALRYHPPGEVLLEPGQGPVTELLFVREGAVSGTRGADSPETAFAYEPGDLFPVGAAVGRRPVTATYRATADTFVLALPVAGMDELAARSAVFADFLNRRVATFLDLSRRAVRAAHAADSLAEQALERRLGELVSRPVQTCGASTPLRDVLVRMHEARIGSMIVVDAAGAPAGILTRSDVLDRVALAQVSLDTPVASVMVSPVHSLDEAQTAQDAALLMSEHGFRHVPVTRAGVVVGMVSERDLFAMQRLSPRQLGAALRRAPDVPTLQRVAQDVRRFARELLGQGVQARQLTALVSHLNDLLTRRLLEVIAPAHGVDLATVCWLALGSEGRGEQTLATDQDNALILRDDADEGARARALAFGQAVNLALQACGFPLCRGGIMAGEPACCLPLAAWRARFAQWIGHGTPQDLLDASIFFDLRPLAGDAALALALQREAVGSARRTPRFLKQLALNAISHEPPLNWLGGIAVDDAGAVDLKLQGAAIYVDAARVYALACGIEATGTRARLEAVGRALGLAPAEHEGWIAGFEFLQMLRLRHQVEGDAAGPPNRLEPARLNTVDRRMLRESLRQARQLQQRLRLDYDR